MCEKQKCKVVLFGGILKDTMFAKSQQAIAFEKKTVIFE